MPRAPRFEYMRPKQACTFDHDGEAVVLSPNDIFSGDDPLVRARPQLFQPVDPARNRPLVEQATAAPGERRGE